MRQSSTNPSKNVLGPSVKEAALIKAIETSGYPLQGIVAEKLIDAGFEVAEEWGFIDRDTNEHRSLDISASRKWGDNKDPVVPSLSLLIECKRSTHPYVFFKKVSEVPAHVFPLVSGVRLNIEEPPGTGSRLYDSAPVQFVLN